MTQAKDGRHDHLQIPSCPIHGLNYTTLHFIAADGKTTTFCSLCIRDLLLKHIQPLIRE